MLLFAALTAYPLRALDAKAGTLRLMTGIGWAIELVGWVGQLLATEPSVVASPEDAAAPSVASDPLEPPAVEPLPEPDPEDPPPAPDDPAVDPSGYPVAPLWPFEPHAAAAMSRPKMRSGPRRRNRFRGRRSSSAAFRGFSRNECQRCSCCPPG